MRILQVNSFAAPVGGTEIYMHGLIEGFRFRGHQVGLFAGSAEEDVRERGVRVVRRPDFEATSLFDDPEVTGAFREFVKGFGPPDGRRPDAGRIDSAGRVVRQFVAWDTGPPADEKLIWLRG